MTGVLVSRFKLLTEVTLPEAKGRQVYMHEIDLENPTVPEGFEDYLDPVIALLKSANAKAGTAFLTVDEKVVKKGATQRRPKPHVDGLFRPSYGGGGVWGHGGGGGGWNHYCNEVPEKRMPVIVASNAVGCRVWSGDFVGEPKNDGDLSHLELGEGELVPANLGYLLSPDCIHESLPMDRDTNRTFIRIALPADMAVSF